MAELLSINDMKDLQLLFYCRHYHCHLYHSRSMAELLSINDMKEYTCMPLSLLHLLEYPQLSVHLASINILHILDILSESNFKLY